ncbi:MAG: WcaI family glycosyltransferase [Novosphingobium sp.]|nr:WcaI family glycosyltransferase [Novosphingobium sp.]
MRILIVGLNYAPEPIGIGPYTTGLAEWLAGRGHEVEVVAGRPYYPRWRTYPGFRLPFWRRSRENGVTIVRCPHYVPRQPGGLRRIVHHLSFAAAALPVAAWRAWRGRPAVVIGIAPSLLSGPVARLAARLGRARLWLHLQDFEADAALATGLVGVGPLAGALAALERAALGAADRVSTISPAMVARLRAKGVAPESTFELRNWANAPPANGRANYRREWGLGERTVALYSGSLGRKQGAQVILDAARRLRGRDDIVFAICGEGPELPALKAEAAGLTNVRFHPLQPAARLMELLETADIHLLPQVDAAADLVLPSKLTNMLASGRPVVATAAAGTGLAEEIEGCGIAVPPGDGAALAEAIVGLTDDRQLAARLGAAARARAGERWSREAILGGFEAQLRALAAAPPRS